MPGYYKKKAFNVFDPKSTAPYKLSRSKIDLFGVSPVFLFG